MVAFPIRSFLAIDLLLNNNGICKQFGFPSKLNKLEINYLDVAFCRIIDSVNMAKSWHTKFMSSEKAKGNVGLVSYPFAAKQYARLENCNKTYIPEEFINANDNRVPS